MQVTNNHAGGISAVAFIAAVDCEHGVLSICVFATS